MEYLLPDESLLYIESYVSSTVQEKQMLALRTSRDKKASDKLQSNIASKFEKLKKES